MPTTRRSTGGARARSGPVSGQSRLSFSNKVTKSVPKPTKKIASKPSPITKVEVSEPPSSKAHDVSTPASPHADSGPAEFESPQIEEKPKSEAASRAEAVGEAQIRRYWTALQKQRKAPRVHQEELDLSEKVLRYFDVSSQYGVSFLIEDLTDQAHGMLMPKKPCIGISRLRRWERADRLGLHPPIEVLAVLLKAESVGFKAVQSAHMDHILNSIAIGA